MPRLLPLLCLCALASQARADDWQPLSSIPGRFSANFPSPPKEELRPLTSGIFQTTTHVWTTPTDPSRSFYIVWTDYPPAVMAQFSPDELFANLIKASTSDHDKIVGDKAITAPGLTGRAIDAEIAGTLFHRLRLYMVDNRLYQVVADVPLADKDNPDALKFINDFHLRNIRDFPARGFYLEDAPLTGWQSQTPTNDNLAAEFLGPGSTPLVCKSAVVIDAYKPGPDDTLTTVAQLLAAQWHGTVAAQPTTLDGEPAFRIDVSDLDNNLKPAAAIVTRHNGILYTITGLMTRDADVRPAVLEIAHAWKWQPLIPVADHLDLLPRAIPVLDGSLLAAYPRDMTINPSKDPPTILDLHLHDVTHDSVPFTAYFHTLDLPPGTTMDQAAQLLLKNFNPSYDTPLAWTPRHGDTARLVTDFSRNADLSKQEGHDVFLKWALFQINPHRLVTLDFVVGAVPPPDREKFNTAANAILDSLTPAPFPTSAPTAK